MWRLYEDWTLKGVLGRGNIGATAPLHAAHLPGRAVGLSDSMPFTAIHVPLCSPMNPSFFRFSVSPLHSQHPSKTQGAFSRSTAIMNSDLGTGLLTLAELLEGGRCWVFCARPRFSLPNPCCPGGRISILRTASKGEATQQCGVGLPTG